MILRAASRACADALCANTPLVIVRSGVLIESSLTERISTARSSVSQALREGGFRVGINRIDPEQLAHPIASGIVARVASSCGCPSVSSGADIGTDRSLCVWATAQCRLVYPTRWGEEEDAILYALAFGGGRVC